MTLSPPMTAKELREVARQRGALPPNGPRRPRSPRKAAPVPSEHEEQAKLFKWAEHPTVRKCWPELALMFAIPNFAGRLGKLTAIHGAKLKREGRKRGVPDVMLPVPSSGYHGLFLEMKRQRGGAVSAEQRAWLAALRDLGYRAERCNGWEAARTVILDYLNMAGFVRAFNSLR